MCHSRRCFPPSASANVSINIELTRALQETVAKINSLKEELPQLYQLHTIGGELDDEWSPGLEGVEQFARSCIGGVKRHM